MKKEKNEKHFINRPSYSGGSKAIGDFIRKNLKYPKEAFTAKVEGVVQVRITINHNGKVEEGKIISSLGYGCNEEAVRVVKLLKFNVPKNRKLKVKFHKKLNVQFKLPKANPVKSSRPAAPQQQVSYSITPTKAKSTPQKDDSKKSNDYEYTIRW